MSLQPFEQDREKVRQALLGYLWVLGREESAELSAEDLQTARESMVGSLTAAESALQAVMESSHVVSRAARHAFYALRLREGLTGERPKGDPELEAATKLCSTLVFQFLQKFDQEGNQTL